MKRIAVVVVVGLLMIGCTREVIVYRDSPTAPAPPEPPAAAAAPSLRFPQGIPDSEIVIVPGIPTLHEEVNAAMAEMFPGCHDSNCDGLGYDPQSFFAVLNDKLRKRGLWAGQHRDGESDEMTVSRTCLGPWENFHAWNYVGTPIWANPVSAPCAGDACRGKNTSYRGNTVIPASFCK